MYFVKLDVRACFDTIDQTKLLQIMRDALSDVSFTSTGLPPCSLTLSQGRVYHQTIRRHRHRHREVQETLAQEGLLIRSEWLIRSFTESDPPSDDLEDFVPYAIELASTLKSTVLVDQIPYQHQRREELMQLLDEHITENIVKVRGRSELIFSTY